MERDLRKKQRPEAPHAAVAPAGVGRETLVEVQARGDLTVGPADSPFEHEADRAADAAAAGAPFGSFSAVTASAAQARAESGGGAAVLPGSLATGGGDSLPGAVRAPLESSYGRPLGDVRVHTDGAAAEAAAGIQAQAFTSGNHIYFGAGRYQPGSPAGDHLIAHEVAHTIQQGGAGGLQAKLIQREPDKAAPAEAPKEEGKTVTTNWSVTYNRKLGRTSQLPSDRAAGKTALTVQNLTVTPESGGGADFQGINTSGDGATSLGSMEHKTGVAGKVTGTFATGGMPGVKVDLTLTDPDPGEDKEAQKAAKKKKAGIPAAKIAAKKKIDQALTRAKDGNLEALQGWLEGQVNGDPAFEGYTAKVVVDPNLPGAASQTFPAGAAYPQVTDKKTNMTVMVDVPTEETKGKYSNEKTGSEKETDEQTWRDKGSKEKATEKQLTELKQTTTSVEASLSRLFSTIADWAVECMTATDDTTVKTHVIEDNENTKEINLGGKAGGKVDLPIPNIPFGINGEGQAGGKLTVRSKTGYTKQVTDGEKKEYRNKFAGQVKNEVQSAYRQQIGTTYMQEVTAKVAEKLNLEHEEGAKKTTETATGSKTFNEGGTLYYICKAPTLTIS